MKIWKFHYGLTAQDYIDFNEHYYDKVPDGRKQLLKMRLIFPVSFLVFLLLSAIIYRDIFTVGVQGIFLGIVTVAAWFAVKPWILTIYKRRLKNPKDPVHSLVEIEGETAFDFENRIITSVDEKEDLKVKFDSVITVYEGKSAYYLYYTKTKAFVLPYRLFESSEKMVEFYNLLHGTFPMADKK